MEKALSKAKNTDKIVHTGVAIGPLFDVDQMQKTLTNSISMYLDQKAVIEKVLKQQAPLVEGMVKQINDSVRMYHSAFANSGIVQMQKEQKRLQESLRSFARIAVAPKSEIFISLQTGIKEKIDEEIFEEVIERVEIESLKLNVVPAEFNSAFVKLPEDARWDDVRIVFKNRDDVNIYYKGKVILETNCEKLGFAKNNTSDKAPNKPWELLHSIAVINDQKISKPTILDLKRMLGIKNNDALHKVKLRLDRQLVKSFGIDDPFFSYKEYGYYKFKFMVSSEPELRNIKDPWASGKGLPKII
ncbi:MAG: hypothetical protein PHP62_00540 [Candidatus Moranbacteria bacterium]|nr:hypothetical protein [Candidatus Moranbacteria bacterium]